MPPSKAWRDYPQRYRLEAARCKKCGKIFFPPRLVCNSCGHREFEIFSSKRTGRLLTYTVVRTPSSEFSGEAPFALGVVQTDDGARMTVQLADVDFDELKVGMPVKLEFRRLFSEGHAGVIHYGHKAVPQRE
jgi:uncharacterized OB-fold protein